jgi:hypothetical protein
MKVKELIAELQKYNKDSVTGNQAKAKFLGSCEADSFKEACDKIMKQIGWSEKDYNSEHGTYWGCKLYDNEKDAREFFG